MIILYDIQDFPEIQFPQYRGTFEEEEGCNFKGIENASATLNEITCKRISI